MRLIRKKTKRLYSAWVCTTINVIESVEFLESAKSQKVEYISEYGHQYYEDFITGAEEGLQVKRVYEGHNLLEFYQVKPTLTERLCIKLLDYFYRKYNLTFRFKDGKTRLRKA